MSPSISVAYGAFKGAMPGGTPITLPPHGPRAKPVIYTDWERDLAESITPSEGVLGVSELGKLRVEVLRSVAGQDASEEQPSDALIVGIYQLTAETIRTVADLAHQMPRRAVLWNQELDVAQFLGRTLLLADHVLYPDQLFGALVRGASVNRLREAAERQLVNKTLLSSGIVIPVPPGVAMAAQGRAVHDVTERDLAQQGLVDWVRQQLIIEGPTAREALFVRAIDDLAHEAPNFWLHGRIDRRSLNNDTGSFRTALLQPYDPDFDYAPWVAQVTDSAVSALVQRTNERVVAADMFGAEYVSASLFEARLLRMRGNRSRVGSAQAALWASIPELTHLDAPDLAKLLKNESAVEDLRNQVRAALATARTDRDSIDAVTELAHQLEAASKRMQRTASSDRAWQAVIPGGLSFASLVVGAFTGGIGGFVGGGLGALAALGPYLGSRLSRRHDAAYLFVTARRAHR